MMRIECARCGYRDELENFGPGQRCPVCHFENEFRISVMESPSHHEKEVEEEIPPLLAVEAEEDFGLKEFIQTFLNLLRSPAAFFSQIPGSTRFLRPFLIAFFIHWIVGGIILLTTGVEQSAVAPVIQRFPEAEAIVELPYFRILFFFLMPVALIVVDVVSALFYHFFLRIFLMAKEPLIHTLRLILYLNFLELLNVLPVAGSFLAGLLGILFLLWGIKTLHRLSGMQLFLFILIIVAMVSFVTLLPPLLLQML